MKVVLQRVKSASVSIAKDKVSEIGLGLLILLGIGEEDTIDDAGFLVKKLLKLRIFSDLNQQMNLSLEQVNGEVLIVSQFTLYASTKKGNRPSFVLAAKPAIAEELYNYFVEQFRNLYSGKVQTGVFGGDMQVALINDGPVTIILDSKNDR